MSPAGLHGVRARGTRLHPSLSSDRWLVSSISRAQNKIFAVIPRFWRANGRPLARSCAVALWQLAHARWAPRGVCAEQIAPAKKCVAYTGVQGWAIRRSVLLAALKTRFRFLEIDELVSKPGFWPAHEHAESLANCDFRQFVQGKIQLNEINAAQQQVTGRAAAQTDRRLLWQPRAHTLAPPELESQHYHQSGLCDAPVS